MRFDVPRIVLQRKREVVERARGLSALEIDDAEVAISFSNVVAFADRFEVMLRGFHVALLVQKKSFFEWRKQTRESRRLDAKQVQLPLQLSFDLADALTLRAQLTHTTKLCQRVEVVDVIRRLRCCGRLDDALLSPATKRLLAQTKKLFDLFDGVR